MNPKRRRMLIFFAAYPVGGALLGALGFVHGALALLVIPWTFIIQRWAASLRCPRCGARVEGERILGWESVCATDGCPHCGERFDARGAAPEGNP